MSVDIKKNIERGTDINIGLSKRSRDKVVEMLNVLLADEHTLYVKLRNYHWNVGGMFFQQLHELFQKQYTALEVHIDDIAERIRSLGFFAPGSLAYFHQHTRLEETDHLKGDAEKMLKQIVQDHEEIIINLRQDVESAEKYRDAGTADFLTALMESHEKMAWLVRTHLA
jgi:starvation-inducible DNA-binding protein